MYHAIVRSRVRSLWRSIEAGDYQAATATAAPDIEFRFVGDMPLAGRIGDASSFESWFAEVFAFLPGIRLSLVEVVVAGPPWNTTVAARLRIAATLADGTEYRNQGVQWARLRWGRLTFDEILFDTLALDAACAVQIAAGRRPPGAALDQAA